MTQKRLYWTVFFFSCMVLVTIAIAIIGTKLKSWHDYQLSHTRKITMRDGTELNAHILLCRNYYFSKSPGPVILRLTPYHKNEALEYLAYRNGYHLVEAYCRGTNKSGGEFMPFQHDGLDGFDLVKWIATQNWCDGRVVMMGGSYEGMTQWLTLKQEPPHLKAIIPMVAMAPGIDAIISKNIPTYNWLRLTEYILGNIDSMYNTPVARLDSQIFIQQLAYQKADSILGRSSSVFKQWLQHPTFDSYYKSILPSPQDYARINIPILSLTGYYDGDQRGALYYFQNHQRYGNPQVNKNHYLVIGPYGHLEVQKNLAEASSYGGEPIEEEATLAHLDLQFEWLDWILKNDKKPSFLKDQVNYYMMNNHEWRSSKSWNDVSQDSIFAPITNRINASLGSLLSFTSNSTSQYDSLINDPIRLSKASLGAYLKHWHKNFIINDTLTTLPQRLIYYTPLIKGDLYLAGCPELELFASFSTPDTDMEVSLYEIDPQGKSFFLTKDELRIRYRNSKEKEELAVPNQIYKLVFHQFGFFAKKIRKGSRLKLVINPFLEPSSAINYNTGKDLYQDSGLDAKTCVIKLHYGKEYPSRFILPIAKK